MQHILLKLKLIFSDLQTLLSLCCILGFIDSMGSFLGGLKNLTWVSAAFSGKLKREILNTYKNLVSSVWVPTENSVRTQCFLRVIPNIHWKAQHDLISFCLETEMFAAHRLFRYLFLLKYNWIILGSKMPQVSLHLMSANNLSGLKRSFSGFLVIHSRYNSFSLKSENHFQPLLPFMNCIMSLGLLGFEGS